MNREITLVLTPEQSANPYALEKAVKSAVPESGTFRVIKRSVDARGNRIKIRYVVEILKNREDPSHLPFQFSFQDVRKAAHSAIIIGAGPAGLFAALKLLETGIKPILLERGKDVRARRRDLASLNKSGILNPESNYCFGEGGAGTFSDGKLYTRSGKRGNILRILQLFVHFGAEPDILYEAHPHIGTNKLPGIISKIREKIIDLGGEFLFEKKVTDLIIEGDRITSLITADGDRIKASKVILATGHSARDVFELLHKKNIIIEPKPFALGVRVEHPQPLIDAIQYADEEARQFLPPAAYSWVKQINDRGVFSFCMCPGGIIAPASTSAGELVINGWSPSRRNNPFANSGIVVQVSAHDAFKEMKNQQISADDPFLFLHFQRQVERHSFDAGGGGFKAPAQRLVDFTQKKYSSTLPKCSYGPGLSSQRLDEVLPEFIADSLAKGFKAIGKSMHRKDAAYFTNEAVVVATESRTSSPVRIPREAVHLNHPQILNLFPCGEGAGYAGGIISAAMDGERVAERISELTGK